MHPAALLDACADLRLHTIVTSKPDEARIEYIVLDGKRIELR